MERQDKVSTVKGDTFDDELDERPQRSVAGENRDRTAQPGEERPQRGAREPDVRDGDGI